MVKALGNDEGEGKKPEQEEPEDKQSFIEAGRFQNLTDGIYTGSADAFRGDVEVQVTVEKQKVTDISFFPLYRENTFSGVHQPTNR